MLYLPLRFIRISYLSKGAIKRQEKITYLSCDSFKSVQNITNVGHVFLQFFQIIFNGNLHHSFMMQDRLCKYVKSRGSIALQDFELGLPLTRCRNLKCNLFELRTQFMKNSLFYMMLIKFEMQRRYSSLMQEKDKLPGKKPSTRFLCLHKNRFRIRIA